MACSPFFSGRLCLTKCPKYPILPFKKANEHLFNSHNRSYQNDMYTLQEAISTAVAGKNERLMLLLSPGNE